LDGLSRASCLFAPWCRAVRPCASCSDLQRLLQDALVVRQRHTHGGLTAADWRQRSLSDSSACKYTVSAVAEHSIELALHCFPLIPSVTWSARVQAPLRFDRIGPDAAVRSHHGSRTHGSGDGTAFAHPLQGLLIGCASAAAARCCLVRPGEPIADGAAGSHCGPGRSSHPSVRPAVPNRCTRPQPVARAERVD